MSTPLPGLPHPCRWGKRRGRDMGASPPLRLSAEEGKIQTDDKVHCSMGPRPWKVMWTNTIFRRFAQATRCKSWPQLPLPNSFKLSRLQSRPRPAQAQGQAQSSSFPALVPIHHTDLPARPGGLHTHSCTHTCARSRPPFLLKAV